MSALSAESALIGSEKSGSGTPCTNRPEGKARTELVVVLKSLEGLRCVGLCGKTEKN
ncbi:hypothetical protein FACS189472_18890 [Alphaproteobacteria bacterium]|nr:hypothetical protein FACS189472_18890 [Alphaproteobacteria bacterium]